MKIFIDMDDVVADLYGYAKLVSNTPNLEPGVRWPDEVWSKLKEDPRFFSKVPIKDGALRMISWLNFHRPRKGYELYFLTAIPRGNDVPWAPYDKVFWADKWFPKIPVFFGPFSHQKHVHCTSSDDILIDDRFDNVLDWAKAGGKAHHYKSWETCLPWLKLTLDIDE